MKKIKMTDETITADQFGLEQELRDLYYNPGTGFRSVNSLYRKVNENGYKASRRQVENFLKEQKVYTKTFPKGTGGKAYQRTIVGDLGQQLQMDLVDMTESRKHVNGGYRWILTSIEILSRYAFTEPSKTKSGVDVAEAMDKVLSRFKVRFGKYPDVVQFDDGNEFKNKNVSKLLDDKGIRKFTTLVKRGGKAFFNRKAAVVERLNETLKRIMWRYFAANDTKKWLHILSDVTFNYNNSVNRGIGMKPEDVNKENKDEVWERLYGKLMETESDKPKFKVGDLVRVEKYHPETRFVKGYTFNFTEEVFKIISVYMGHPIMYGIKDTDTGEEIKGRFYGRELSKVITPGK